jgi:hypothetical protein
VETQGEDMATIMQTREERREELKRLTDTPNGIDMLYSGLVLVGLNREKP